MILEVAGAKCGNALHRDATQGATGVFPPPPSSRELRPRHRARFEWREPRLSNSNRAQTTRQTRPACRLPRISHRIGAGATHEETTAPAPERRAAHARLGPAKGHAESEDRRAARADGRARLATSATSSGSATRSAERRLHPSIEMRVWEHIDRAGRRNRSRCPRGCRWTTGSPPSARCSAELEHRADGGNRGGEPGARRQGDGDGESERERSDACRRGIASHIGGGR